MSQLQQIAKNLATERGVRASLNLGVILLESGCGASLDEVKGRGPSNAAFGTNLAWLCHRPKPARSTRARVGKRCKASVLGKQSKVTGAAGVLFALKIPGVDNYSRAYPEGERAS